MVRRVHAVRLINLDRAAHTLAIARLNVNMQEGKEKSAIGVHPEAHVSPGVAIQIAQLVYQLLMMLSAFVERHREDGAAVLDATLDITLKTIPFLVAVFGKSAVIVEQNGRYLAGTFAQWVAVKTVFHSQIDRLERLLDDRTPKSERCKLICEIIRHFKRAAYIVANPATFRRNWNDIAESIAFNSTIAAWLMPITVVYLQGIQYPLSVVAKFLWIVIASSMNVSRTTAELYYVQLGSFITSALSIPQILMLELGYSDNTARKWKSLAAAKAISFVAKAYRILVERYIARPLALFGLHVPHVTFPVIEATDELPSPAEATIATTASTDSHELQLVAQTIDVTANFADWINGYQQWRRLSEVSQWVTAPKHLAVILTYLTTSDGEMLIEKAAQTIEWAIELGISVLTIYEKSGQLVAGHKDIGISAKRRLQNNGNSSFNLRLYSPSGPYSTQFTPDGIIIEQPWEPHSAPPQYNGLLVILTKQMPVDASLFELTQSIAEEVTLHRVLAAQVTAKYIRDALTISLLGIPSRPDLVISDCCNTQGFPLYSLNDAVVFCHDGHSYESKVVHGLLNYTSTKPALQVSADN
ncbi:hypothetical protein TRVA0_011S01552 [Trichomonascus vanleenenianus]|uniref:uncharacterized protein n=1 Tax=Trichomonascus vanleenenianus TaxID=2268995 RepID=UPI003ECAB2EE